MRRTAGIDVDRPRREHRQHAGAHGRHLHRRRRADRGDELATEGRLPRDEPRRSSGAVALDVAFHVELDRVAGEARAEARRRARRHLAAPRGRTGEDRPRLLDARPVGNRARDVFFDVVAVEVHDRVGAPRREHCGLGLLDGDGDGVTVDRDR